VIKVEGKFGNIEIPYEFATISTYNIIILASLNGQRVKIGAILKTKSAILA
jgi:hypothetical protein